MYCVNKAYSLYFMSQTSVKKRPGRGSLTGPGGAVVKPKRRHTEEVRWTVGMPGAVLETEKGRKVQGRSRSSQTKTAPYMLPMGVPRGARTTTADVGREKGKERVFPESVLHGYLSPGFCRPHISHKVDLLSPCPSARPVVHRLCAPDACTNSVCTIFRRNARPASQRVYGERINMAIAWYQQG